LADTEEPESRPAEAGDEHTQVPSAPSGDNSFDAVAGGFIAEVADGERAAQCEHLEGLGGDKRLHDELASQQFHGLLHERFEDELVRYALAVLNAWLISGTVFEHLRSRGVGLETDDYTLKLLRDDSDERQGLADAVVAAALPDFRRRALRDGGWASTGQASLTTYFMGTCLWKFPNEYRRFNTDLRRNQLARPSGEDILLDEQPGHAQPVDAQAVDKIGLSADLAEHPPRTQAAVILALYGYTQIEIAELLDATEKAVEGRLFRWRKREKKRWTRGR
jgi:Sigma-70, region 4